MKSFVFYHKAFYCSLDQTKMVLSVHNVMLCSLLQRCITPVRLHVMEVLQSKCSNSSFGNLDQIGTGGLCASGLHIKALSEHPESLPLWPFGLDQV